MGVGFAREYRLMLAIQIAAAEPALAELLVASTEVCLAAGCWPCWNSDGLDAYGAARLARHHVVQTFPRTGKPGRPRRLRLVAHPRLRYGKVVKQWNEQHRVIEVTKRGIFGAPLLSQLMTVYIERHYLTLRQENRRLSRKTIGFSKSVEGLRHQLTLYRAFYNL